MAIGKNINKDQKETGNSIQKASSTSVDDSMKKDTNSVNDDTTYGLAKAEPNIEKSKMLVVFAVGKEEYALSIDQIKEVVPMPPISPVPQTKNYVLGVANVRGNVLAVIDMEERFGLKTGEKKSKYNYVIVIDHEEIKVAIVSHHVPETLTVLENQIDSSADIMRTSGNEQNFIKGVIKKDNRMIIFIDILEMVDHEKLVND